MYAGIVRLQMPKLISVTPSNTILGPTLAMIPFAYVVAMNVNTALVKLIVTNAWFASRGWQSMTYVRLAVEAKGTDKE